MWDTKKIIKRIFSKTYNNINNITETISNTINKFVNPKLFIGSNFIGGGIMGTSINISSSISNNILNCQIKNHEHYFKEIANETVSTSKPDETFLIFNKIINSNNIVIINFKGSATSVQTPLPASFILQKNNINIPNIQDHITMTARQITSFPVRFRNEYRGYLVIDNVKQGDTITFMLPIQAPLEGVGIVYSLFELTESSDNLPNNIHVFVTE